MGQRGGRREVHRAAPNAHAPRIESPNPRSPIPTDTTAHFQIRMSGLVRNLPQYSHGLPITTISPLFALLMRFLRSEALSHVQMLHRPGMSPSLPMATVSTGRWPRHCKMATPAGAWKVSRPSTATVIPAAVDRARENRSQLSRSVQQSRTD